MATGILHPGEMGATVGSACADEVVWASDGRSGETRDRADQAGLVDVVTLSAMAVRADVIVSVCPPGAALETARAVADSGFEGVFVDANAVSPATARAMGEMFEKFVDGGIVGPPAVAAGSTRLYLSGADAAQIAARWEGSVLEARVLDGRVGAASALKMSYAAWTKGSAALLLDTVALAASSGVLDELIAEWKLSQPGLGARGDATATATGPKAWRWIAEMEQIAETFSGVGLPSGFHEGAAEVYRRLAADHEDEVLDLAGALRRLRQSG